MAVRILMIVVVVVIAAGIIWNIWKVRRSPRFSVGISRQTQVVASREQVTTSPPRRDIPAEKQALAMVTVNISLHVLSNNLMGEWLYTRNKRMMRVSSQTTGVTYIEVVEGAAYLASRASKRLPITLYAIVADVTSVTRQDVVTNVSIALPDYILVVPLPHTVERDLKKDTEATPGQLKDLARDIEFAVRG